jgi:hypothetical protein
MSLAVSHNNLGKFAASQGDSAAASRHFSRVQDISQHFTGPLPSRIAWQDDAKISRQGEVTLGEVFQSRSRDWSNSPERGVVNSQAQECASDTLALLREILFPGDSVTMDQTKPIAARIAFLRALMLAQNESGFAAHLYQIPEQDDLRIRRLRAVHAQWKAGLTWAQRLGLRAKPPLPQPPPD